MNKRILYFLGFLIKGWEFSLLLVLPILNLQGKINVYEVGILAAVFSISQMITALFSGHLGEKFGSKRIIVSGIFFYGLAWLLLSLPISFPSVLAVCILGGFGTGSFIPLANSAIAKMSEKNRAKEMGDFSAFSDIGRIVLIGVTTFLIDKFGIFYVSIVFAALAIISVMALARTAFVQMSSEQPASQLSVVKLRHIIAIKSFRFAVLIGVFDVFASASLFIFVPLLLVPKGINISSVGFLSALFFLGYLVGRLFLGRLADKFGAVKVLVLSELAMAVFILGLVFINNFLLICSVLFILGVFTRGTSPVIRAMMASSVKEKGKFDKAFSIHSFVLNISNMGSRSVYGFIAGVLGIASVFYLSAFVVMATLLPLYLFKKSK